MSDESALLAVIAANPDEHTPRLMLADWLDEHGDDLDKYGALWLRTWCEQRTCPIDGFTMLAMRERIIAGVLRHHGWRLFDALGVDRTALIVEDFSGEDSTVSAIRRFRVTGVGRPELAVRAPGIPRLREPLGNRPGLRAHNIACQGRLDGSWLVVVNYVACPGAARG